MKKLRFFSLMIAALGLGFGLTSCEEDDLLDDEGEAVTISVDASADKTEVEVGETITVSYDVLISDNRLETIEFLVGGEVVETVSDEFDDNRRDAGEFTYEATEAGEFTLTVRAMDNDENQKTASLDVNVIAAGGDIHTYTAVLLGDQDAEVGSSYSTSKDEVYTVSEAQANADDVDFIHYQGATNGVTIASPDGDGVAEFSVFSLGSWSTLNSTRFIVANDVDFGSVQNDAPIVEAAEAANSKEMNDLSEGDVVAFVTDAGKKGVFEVSEITDESITIEVKVQQ